MYGKDKEEKNNLIYAPFPKKEDKKKKIKTIINPNFYRVSTFPYGNIISIWNGVYSKALRANIREFVVSNYYKKQYKEDFEDLLWKYGYNIYNVIIESLGLNKKVAGEDLNYINITKITLSPDLYYEKYNNIGNNIDKKYKIDDPSNNNIGYNKDNKYKIDDPKEIDRIINKEDENTNSNECVNSLVLGEYYPKSGINHNDHEIVLYVEAMKQEAERKELDIEDLFLSVFIHEYFHAVHHEYCDKLNGDSHDTDFCNDGNIVIIESLAAAFEYYFCKNVLKNNKLETNFMNMWSKYSVSIYPYSGAKGIISCKESYLQVIEKIIKNDSFYSDILKNTNGYTDRYLLCLAYLFVYSLKKMGDAQNELIRICI